MTTKLIGCILVLLKTLILIFCSEQKGNNTKRKLEIDYDSLSDDIIILHTNDVHGVVMDNIGYDGLMLYKKELQKKYKYVITVDVGDHIQAETLTQAYNIIQIMNHIQYDVITIGEHEFDFGLEQIDEFDKSLYCGYTCSNFCLNNNPYFEPYKIIDTRDRKICFIGIIKPIDISKIISNEHADINTYSFGADNTEEEFYNYVYTIIDRFSVENEKYIFIILSHLGIENDEQSKYTSDGLLSSLFDVKAVLEGHTHQAYNDFKKDKNGNDIPIIQAGSNFSHIGVLTITTDEQILIDIISEIPEPEDKTGAMQVWRHGKNRWVDV